LSGHGRRAAICRHPLGCPLRADVEPDVGGERRRLAGRNQGHRVPVGGRARPWTAAAPAVRRHVRARRFCGGGNTIYPAVAFGIDQGALALTLTGQVTFLGNTSRFYGLKVSTKGQVSLAGASLISKPLTIVANTLTVDDLLIQNNALRTDLSVTLPDPLNSGGPQKVNFSIDAQGHIAGGAVIAVINEPEGVTGNADTHFAMGSVATVHLRYL